MKDKNLILIKSDTKALSKEEAHKKVLEMIGKKHSRDTYQLNKQSIWDKIARDNERINLLSELPTVLSDKYADAFSKDYLDALKSHNPNSKAMLYMPENYNLHEQNIPPILTKKAKISTPKTPSNWDDVLAPGKIPGKLEILKSPLSYELPIQVTIDKQYLPGDYSLPWSVNKYYPNQEFSGETGVITKIKGDSPQHALDRANAMMVHPANKGEQQFVKSVKALVGSSKVPSKFLEHMKILAEKGLKFSPWLAIPAALSQGDVFGAIPGIGDILSSEDIGSGSDIVPRGTK